MKLLRGPSCPTCDRGTGTLAFCPGLRALKAARAAPPFSGAIKLKARAFICLARLTKAAMKLEFFGVTILL